MKSNVDSTMRSITLLVDPIKNREYYLASIPVKDIVINKKYLVRDLDDNWKETLKQQIRDQGLIEPLAVHDDDNGQFTLLSGQHRLAALRELNAKEVPCRCYIKLDEHTKRLLGFMANELRKRPSAGKRFEALHDIFDQKYEDLKKTTKKAPSEQEVISQLYYGTTKGRTTEIILGRIIDRLRADKESEVRKYGMIQNAQVPATALDDEIQSGRYPLLTAQNAYFALSHLVRTQPVTKEEMDQGKYYRDNEYINVLDFFNFVITEFVVPWIRVGEKEAAVNFCKRHPFEAFAKVISQFLVEQGFPMPSSTQAPFYHSRKIPWAKVVRRFIRLKDAKIWNYNMIADERAVNELVNRLRHYNDTGRLPSL